jgi:HAMP domain-containing protein
VTRLTGALPEAGCEKYFSDKITGSTFERKGLEELLAFVQAGDTVVVWKLDRLGRSLKDLIETLNLLKDLQKTGQVPTYLGIVQGVLFTSIIWVILVTPASLIFGVLVTRGLVRRVKRLVDATTSFAQGDYSQRVPVSRSDEVGLLEERFHQMAQQLVESMPLGLMPGMSYEEKETTLMAGDSVLFYSDGLVEAHNPNSEMFGFPRLMSLLKERMDDSAITHFLLDHLKEFTGPDWEQEDDVTLVTLQRSA